MPNITPVFASKHSPAEERQLGTNLIFHSWGKENDLKFRPTKIFFFSPAAGKESAVAIFFRFKKIN
jgi:hypothetical protein